LSFSFFEESVREIYGLSLWCYVIRNPTFEAAVIANIKSIAVPGPTSEPSAALKKIAESPCRPA
jgi:hypothetical protein